MLTSDTPGGTARSPVRFALECTPSQEQGSARKRRRDRNRQAAKYAAVKAAQKRRLNPLEHERRIVDSVDEEQPELSFDMDELDDTILMAQRSQQPDRRAAADMLHARDGSVEERLAAAVHLMMGVRWTSGGRERVPCARCGRKFAVRADGLVRQHSCVYVAHASQVPAHRLL